MKRMYPARRSPLTYVAAMCLVMFVLAELFVMVVGSKVSLIEHVLYRQLSHTDYSEGELPANKIEIPISLAEQGVGLTTNVPPVLKETLEKHAHEGLSIEPDMNGTDDEIEPVG